MSMITDDNGSDNIAGEDGADETGQEGGELGESDAPPASEARPPSFSRLALRDDGKLMISLENADDRDLSGREIVRFMLLSTEESASARALADEALAEGAASIIGRLPKKRS